MRGGVPYAQSTIPKADVARRKHRFHGFLRAYWPAFCPLRRWPRLKPANRPAPSAERSVIDGGPFGQAFIIPSNAKSRKSRLDSVSGGWTAPASRASSSSFRNGHPGGALGPTLKICDAIKQPAPTGSGLRLGESRGLQRGGGDRARCDGIVMADNATMGDAQPDHAHQPWGSVRFPRAWSQGDQPASGGAARLAWRNRLRPGPGDVAGAARDAIFWLVNDKTGEHDFTEAAGRNRLFRADGHAAGGGQRPPWAPSRLRRAEHNRLALRARGSAHRPGATAHRHRPRLLTMRNNRAQAYGLSKATVSTDSQLRDFFHITGQIQRAPLTFVERAVEWAGLADGAGGVVHDHAAGVYAEFHAPGVGLPGATALAALILFLGAPYMAGFTVTWEIVVIIVGLALIGVEVFRDSGLRVWWASRASSCSGSGCCPRSPPPNRYGVTGFDLPEMPQTYAYMRNGMIALMAGFAGGPGRHGHSRPVLAAGPDRQPPRRREPPPATTSCPRIPPRHRQGRRHRANRNTAASRRQGPLRRGAGGRGLAGRLCPSGVKVEVVERCGNRVVVREAVNGNGRVGSKSPCFYGLGVLVLLVELFVPSSGPAHGGGPGACWASGSTRRSRSVGRPASSMPSADVRPAHGFFAAVRSWHRTPIGRRSRAQPHAHAAGQAARVGPGRNCWAGGGKLDAAAAGGHCEFDGKRLECKGGNTASLPAGPRLRRSPLGPDDRGPAPADGESTPVA